MLHGQFCECDSTNCNKKIQMTTEEVQKKISQNLVLIVDGCKTGPNPTDKFMEKKEGYTFYKETI